MVTTVDEREKPATRDEWEEVSSYILEELYARQIRRKDQALIWKEIDRQLAMQPLPRETKSGEKKDWYPELETPLQFNTLEVIAADARRLLFPRNTDWFQATSNIDSAYIQKFEQRRAASPLVEGSLIPEKLDQETADTLVKVTIDHYHKLYDFRGKIDLFLAEAIKYGTAVCRVRDMKLAKFSHDYRGTGDRTIVGPAVIPCPLSNTYLDDRDAMMAHEGVVIGPAVIRDSWQFLTSLKKAAVAGGAEDGWLMENVNRLEAKSGDDFRRGQIYKVEYEGDLVIPRKNTSGFLFMPNVLVTVAVGTVTEVVRFKTNAFPFRSYITGHYMREDVKSAYGTSPLMKGQPIAEACASALNDLMACGALHVRPPVSYDRHDANLLAMGGPEVFPGALWPASNPERVIPHQIGDPSALLQGYIALTKQYEDVTGVNDPRRGAQTKSHTTATAIDIESTKGMSRTDDFVAGIQKGPLTTMLYMEYEIIKKVMRKPQPIPVNMNGIDGWVTLDARDLPDEVAFNVSGAVGVLEEKERHQNFLSAVQTAVQLQQAAMQAGVPFNIDFQAMAIEEFKRAGINNAAKFISPATGLPGGAAGAAGLPGLVEGVPPSVSPTVQAAQQP